MEPLKAPESKPDAEGILPEERPSRDRFNKCEGCNKEIQTPTEMEYQHKKRYYHYCCMRSVQAAESKVKVDGARAMQEAEQVRKDFATQIKDSGQRQEFVTGAVRDTQSGKGRYDLVPPLPLHLLGQWFEAGCLKYGERNFERGIPVGRYVDSAFRHLNKYRMGLRDEPHLIAGLWNLWNAIDTVYKIKLGLLPKELDDYNYTKDDLLTKEAEKLLLEITK
jgi:hypothetical protein